jgi:hypothetical protein
VADAWLCAMWLPRWAQTDHRRTQIVPPIEWMSPERSHASTKSDLLHSICSAVPLNDGSVSTHKKVPARNNSIQQVDPVVLWRIWVCPYCVPIEVSIIHRVPFEWIQILWNGFGSAAGADRSPRATMPSASALGKFLYGGRGIL